MILKNALIYTPENTFKKGDLAVNGNVISEPAAGDSKIFDASGLYAIPGLTDIHLHGCMGHDFCDATEDTLEAIAAYQARSGVTGFNGENKHIIEYNLKLDSNPEFTSSVLCAFARAINRLHQEGVNGCKTVFDIAPAYLSPLSGEELRAHML